MKNLKKFNTEAEYNTFKNSSLIKYPLVSYINETRETKFNHWIPTQGSLKMYTDDDFYTNTFIRSTIEMGIGGSGGNTFVFVQELIYENSYFWLWEATYDTVLIWENNGMDCMCYYILTEPFNNYNDLYEHTLQYSYNNRYCPIMASLGDDMENNHYWDCGGWNATDEVLVMVSGGTYTGDNDEDNTIFTMVLDGMGAHEFWGVDSYAELTSIGYNQGNHVYDLGGQATHDGSGMYYEYSGQMTYEGNTYYAWTWKQPDSWQGGAPQYCLSYLSPLELMSICPANGEWNEYDEFIFLNEDRENYPANNGRGYTRYLIDVFVSS